MLTPEWTRWPRRGGRRRRRFAASVVAAPELLELKLRAIACYDSQWRLFYRALDDWRVALGRYGRALGAAGAVERRWRELPPAPAAVTRAVP
jgi:hypothetical protein